MFDIGGMELLLIFIIILVVAGPERLPGIIKTIGRWTGYARRTVNQFKRDFEDEFEVAELRKEIKASTQMEELSSLQSDLKNIGKDLDKELDDAEKSFKTIQDDAKNASKDENTSSDAGPAKPVAASADDMPEPPRYSGEELVRMAAKSRGIDPDADAETIANSDLPEVVAERERKIAQQLADSEGADIDSNDESGSGADNNRTVS